MSPATPICGDRGACECTFSVLHDCLVFHKGHISLLHQTPAECQTGRKKRAGQRHMCHSGESACRPRANHPISAVVTLILSLILHITHVSNTDKKNLQFALWSCNLSSHTLNANFWHSRVTAFPCHQIEVLEGQYSIKVITYSHSTL